MHAGIPTGGYSDVDAARVNETTHAVLVSGDVGHNTTTQSLLLFFDGSAFSAPTILNTSVPEGGARGANLLKLPDFRGSDGELVRPAGPTAVVSGQLGTQLFAPWLDGGRLRYPFQANLAIPVQGVPQNKARTMSATLVGGRTLVIASRTAWKVVDDPDATEDAPNLVYQILEDGTLRHTASFAFSCQSVNVAPLESIARGVFAIANGGEADYTGSPHQLFKLTCGCADAPKLLASGCSTLLPKPGFSSNCPKQAAANTSAPVDAEASNTRTRKITSAMNGGDAFVLTVNSAQVSYIWRYTNGQPQQLWELEESTGNQEVYARGGDVLCHEGTCRVALTFWEGRPHLWLPSSFRHQVLL